ncbi:MAG TPA: hypothetical protein VHA11_08480 [Bryobacteraceae bacterium]|nr:hypothetical protein [Bryobacteraceae bacterium]
MQNLLLKQSVRAASVVMGGFIVLLVFGTQVLDWRWITALAVLGIAAGFRTLPREVPSRYAIAQNIDRRLDLADALSTAHYFATHERRVPEDIRRAQAEQAERLAARVDVVLAVPFTVPKSIYAMAILGLVASSLFALRYGMTRTLDLRAPLAALVFDAFHFSSEPQVAEKKKREVRHADDRMKPVGLPLDQDSERVPGAQGSLPGLSSEAPDAAADNQQSGKDGSRERGSATAEAMNRRSPASDRGEGSGEGQRAAAGSERENSGQSSSDGETSGRSSANQQADASRNESNSLLDKFRDAMSNLMSRLKPQPRSGESQSASAQSQKSESNQARRERGQNGSQRSGRQAEGSPNGEPDGDQQGEGDQKAQNGPGKEGGRDAEEASRQGQTGIGKSDGSKDIRAAEQLAAMGKISELIGKRSENQTGEMMVEVASGKQDLRTPYSQQASRHGDSGGEIHRDEIPLAYQRYVQHYFEQVRKAAPPAAQKAH